MYCRYLDFFRAFSDKCEFYKSDEKAGLGKQ